MSDTPESLSQDSWQAMLAAVRAYHEKHRFWETGGEEHTCRVALMAEELGEISACVTKVKSKDSLTEGVSDFLILLMGTGSGRFRSERGLLGQDGKTDAARGAHGQRKDTCIGLPQHGLNCRWSHPSALGTLLSPVSKAFTS